MLADTYAPPRVAAELPAEGRASFLRKTYVHLMLAVFAFVGIEAAIFLLVPAETLFSITRFMTGGYMWLVVLGAFMGVSYLAESMARRSTSLGTQYGGLGLYVVAEALIFVPLLTYAVYLGGSVVLPAAAALTGLIFIGLTAFVFMSGINFSFLRGFMVIGGLAAMGAIGLSVVFGWSLGIWFTAAMVVFAGGAVLYQTSNILHVYREDQHVSAALGLFAAVALLFYYVLTFVMSMGRD